MLQQTEKGGGGGGEQRFLIIRRSEIIFVVGSGKQCFLSLELFFVFLFVFFPPNRCLFKEVRRERLQKMRFTFFCHVVVRCVGAY